jgi:hypothetical protein
LIICLRLHLPQLQFNGLGIPHPFSLYFISLLSWLLSYLPHFHTHTLAMADSQQHTPVPQTSTGAAPQFQKLPDIIRNHRPCKVSLYFLTT